MKTLSAGKYLIGLVFLTYLQLALMPVNHAQSLKQMLLMPGKVTENHQQYEASCDSCHSDFEREQQTSLCLDCHETIKKDLDKNNGFHGLNPSISSKACVECHTDHKGRDFDIVGLDKDTFNHNQTNFLMAGKHQGLACNDCHQKKKQSHDYRINQYQCKDCHAKKSPHKEINPFGKNADNDCGSCHDSNSWQRINFDHDLTQFPLKNAHSSSACQNCHINEQYQGIAKQCSSCHAIDDIHQQRFGSKCESCHNDKEWKQAFFDHDKDTDFKLQFRHSDIRCESCHTQSAQSQTLATECISCHRGDDIHNGNQGKKCDSCHTPQRWSTARFDHDSETDFALTGEHRDAACNSCHNQQSSKQQKNNVAGRECVDCHRVADPHAQSLGENCEQCHNTQAWRKNLFSHDLVEFPLIGMHRQLSCEECHINTQYSETDNSCYGCHQNTDTHKGALGQQCEQCHTPNDWTMWLFDHDRQSDYALTGAHQDLQCKLCHNNEKAISQKCGNCHRDDDVHRGSFGQQCQHCHNDQSFSR